MKRLAGLAAAALFAATPMARAEVTEITVT